MQEQIKIRMQNIGIDETIEYKWDKEKDIFSFSSITIYRYSRNPYYKRRQALLDTQEYVEEEKGLRHVKSQSFYPNYMFNQLELSYQVANLEYNKQEDYFSLKEVKNHMLNSFDSDWIDIKGVYLSFVGLIDQIKEGEKRLRNHG